jgi:hypothetical protein
VGLAGEGTGECQADDALFGVLPADEKLILGNDGAEEFKLVWFGYLGLPERIVATPDEAFRVLLVVEGGADGYFLSTAVCPGALVEYEDTLLDDVAGDNRQRGAVEMAGTAMQVASIRFVSANKVFGEPDTNTFVTGEHDILPVDAELGDNHALAVERRFKFGCFPGDDIVQLVADSYVELLKTARVAGEGHDLLMKDFRYPEVMEFG